MLIRYMVAFSDIRQVTLLPGSQIVRFECCASTHTIEYTTSQFVN